MFNSMHILVFVSCACLQELLRRYGLMPAYNAKLVASTAAADSSSKHTFLPEISGIDCFGCRTGSEMLPIEETAPAHQEPGATWQPGPGGVRPLKTMLSPMALLLLLAYMGATVFYLYTRASRIVDLGSQWW